MNITPVILCGGSGTRLWPISRKNFPKQFLNLVGDSTLFQQSLRRVIALENKDFKIDEILIITNENHRFLVLEQINNMNLTVPTRILLEPESKNTAPAMTLAALAADEKNPESILVVTPADQYVKDLNKFTETMHLAIKAVIDKAILTLGINPTRPETGFGYIQYEGDDLIKNVLSFKEKPDLDTAQKFISQGQYSWNGGMFILHSRTWLDAIHMGNQEISQQVRRAWKDRDFDQWFERPNMEAFQKSPSDSIDYAVIEKSQELGLSIKLVILNAGWSDFGSFIALDEIEKKDKNGNIFKGDVVALNTNNSIVISSKKNVSLLGVDNLIVIETSDSVLVVNKDDAQSIKELVKILEKDHQSLLNEDRKVNRPWGWFDVLKISEKFKVKLIQIDSGKSISLQRHYKRSEHWVVVKGVATITKDNTSFDLFENQSTYIEKKQIHRISNRSDNPLMIIEVQSGNYLGEDDIERLEDKYGRKN
jgi:mannose-1-phosphate guanylyltransferase/mannose-6-phosphate isomerase